MLYGATRVREELSRRFGERGKLLNYTDALEIKGTGLWATFSPDKDPYVKVYLWKVVNGNVVPVDVGELAKVIARWRNELARE